MHRPGELIRRAVRRSPLQRAERVDRWEQRKLRKTSAWRDRQKVSIRSDIEQAAAREKLHQLSAVSIELCDVSQIGPKTRETLRSHGINTAEDLHRSRRRLMRIPGIGPDRADQLRAWLSLVEHDLTAKRSAERQRQNLASKRLQDLPERYEERLSAIRTEAAAKRQAIDI